MQLMEQHEQLQGEIVAVLFKNEENGYAVVKLHTTEGADVTVVGTIPYAALGEQLEVTGTWAHHRKHGAQFKTSVVTRALPATESAMLAYLSSGVLKGIGAATAEAIVRRFGARSLEILDQEPELLAEVKGISKKKASEMGQEFAKQNTVRHLMEFLDANGFMPHIAMRLYQVYGDIALDKLRTNPYLVLEGQYDRQFPQADAMALSMEIDRAASIRIDAGLLCQMYFNVNQGHCYLPRDALVSTTAQLLNLDIEPVEIALDNMIDGGRFIAEPHGVYLPQLFAAEIDVAQRLMTLHESPPPPVGAWETLVEEMEGESGLALADCQREAVRACVENALFVLTGGPGTGKTTTIRVAVDVFKALNLDVVLAAPTGRAAKRMSELTGHEATTIHRLLEIWFDSADEAIHYRYDEDNPLSADVIVVDEMSMVDIQLMQALLTAIKPDARLILVGDADQLPSVGPGNVLREILDSEIFAVTQLTEIFRQAAESRIIVAAHEINGGDTPNIQNDGDLYLLKRGHEDAVIDTLNELCATRLPENMGFAPEQIQVISPTRRGVCGTIHLNKMLQQTLNPFDAQKAERRFGDTIYRLGDRVMQVRNNYDLEWVDGINEVSGRGVFNGDIGLVTAVSPGTDSLTVVFADREVEYPFDLLYELELAYAMTVHKAQGSEFPAVLFVAMPAPPMLLNRKVLYTAMTRARELMIVVGRVEVLEAMVKKKQSGKRFTSLRTRLEELS
ncbi:MAG: ATP-dependent RecD-like DNA helicase [Oscillospiraceae bacterium]|nr:ATP-dependent RecD-like DNA helicase [Oscillospiraceae bacterium]